MCVWDAYLKGQSNVQFLFPGLTNVFQQIWPADPLRFYFLIPPPTGGQIYVAFGQFTPTLIPELTVTSSANPIQMSADVCGDLITLPIWARLAAAGPTSVRTVSVSYLPERWRAYERYAEQQLVKAGAFRPFE